MKPRNSTLIFNATIHRFSCLIMITIVALFREFISPLPHQLQWWAFGWFPPLRTDPHKSPAWYQCLSWLMCRRAWRDAYQQSSSVRPTPRSKRTRHMQHPNHESNEDSICDHIFFLHNNTCHNAVSGKDGAGWKLQQVSNLSSNNIDGTIRLHVIILIKQQDRNWVFVVAFLHE